MTNPTKQIEDETLEVAQGNYAERFAKLKATVLKLKEDHDALAVANAALIAERGELRKKVVTTRDGVVIVFGMKVWTSYRVARQWTVDAITAEGLGQDDREWAEDPMKVKLIGKPEDCYSTRELAKAAVAIAPPNAVPAPGKDEVKS